MKNVIKITHEIPVKMIANLLCNALEGGSNYWYMIEKKVEPKKIEFHEKIGADATIPALWMHEYPLNPGGALVLSDPEGKDKNKRYLLDEKAVERGLQLFANSKEMSHHWGDVLKESDDATTADVFLQFCVFGEVIYG
jgi:hypothetical protein